MTARRAIASLTMILLAACSARSAAPPIDGGPPGDAVGADGGGPDAHDIRDAGAASPCTEVCDDDSHCVEGECVPWARGEFDGTCGRSAAPGPLRPQIQCTWSGPGAGDPEPDARDILHTPIVATLKISLGPDEPYRPNIVFVSDASYTEATSRICEAAGILRVLDGATCTLLASATDPGDRLNSSVTPAAGDLDGDGRVEIVAAASAGGLIALRYDELAGTMVRVWRSHTATGADDLHGGHTCQWGGVSLYDLDDDGRSEVLFEGAVYSADGLLLSTVPDWSSAQWGVPALVANVDDDDAPELIASHATWEWNASARSFVAEARAGDPRREGSAGSYVALADFGDFPHIPGDAPGRPEVVVVDHGGTVRVQALGGETLVSFASPSWGGGSPTVADYDGDGQPEIGAAFGDHYAVFDPIEHRELWRQAAQDHSSARTASSVFDFDGDGHAEVVYGDECYVRIYDGTDGEVLFSQARYSPTWQENPIVADVDGDGAAEIAMPMAGRCRPEYCPGWDPLFAGLRCEIAEDCPGGACDAGFCRCGTDADCGATYACGAALPATPGTGSVCRARHLDCEPGLRVYRDARDRWASSRPVWNQHAYHVTNVNDDGTIPRTRDVRRNWLEEGLNNFRQNVQGDLDHIGGTDITVGALEAHCETDATRMTAQLCNRGAVLADSGVEVIFRQAGGSELCRLRTAAPIAPGECTPVSCVAAVGAEGVFEAVADPDAILAECQEENNQASGEADCLF